MKADEILNEAANPAQQAAIAINMKKHGKKPKNENVVSEADRTDTVTMDVPLLLRMMEYAREDAKTDMDLHTVTEKMIELSKSHDYLCMDNYNDIVGNAVDETIVKHGSQYRLQSKHGHKNLGTFKTKSAAEKHEREVQYFKHKNESVEEVEEAAKKKGPKPTNPELWSRAKAAARAKYDVYPSAYANGYASKWYKEHGGGWRS